MPIWGKPKENRADDRTGVLFMPVGRKDFEFQLPAVGGDPRTKDPTAVTGIEKRDAIAVTTKNGEQIFSIPDGQPGGRWYRIPFSRRAGARGD